MEVDTAKDIQFYSHLVATLGQSKADKVAPGIFSEDLSWMDWEACRSNKPKPFFYKILDIDGDLRLVHQRDLQTREDILTKINKSTRFGLEYHQMSKVRERLILAENGAVAVWTSPKKMLAEDPDYPLDQINTAKKIDEETVWVKQLQGDFVPVYPLSLEALMLNIGEDDLGLDWDMDDDEIDEVKGQAYLEAIKLGLSAEELRKKRAEFFMKLYPNRGSVMTSCGVVSFGGSLPFWCESLGPAGENLRCKICKKDLKRSAVNSHRCVC